MSVKVNQKFITKDPEGNINGYLIPIYNINEGFHEIGNEPQQVYLTVVEKGCIKGPHLHHIRTGFFTCIKGDVRIITRENNKYKEYCSGEKHNYLSVIIPKGVPAAIQNIGTEPAFIINMPSPAWTPTMNDEHTADFSDFNFEYFY